MAVARHRRNHIEQPAAAIMRAANKGRDVRDDREQLVAAAENGDTHAAFLALHQIAIDLRKTVARLEVTADAAAADGQRLVVGSLSSQLIRALEVRAKIAGIGGYAPPRPREKAGEAFVLNINYSSREPTRIKGVCMLPDDPVFASVPAHPLPIGHASQEAGTSDVADEGDEEEFDEDV